MNLVYEQELWRSLSYEKYILPSENEFTSLGRLKLSLLKQVTKGVMPKSFYVLGPVCNLQGMNNLVKSR